jgi:hypothetical protein
MAKKVDNWIVAVIVILAALLIANLFVASDVLSKISDSKISPEIQLATRGDSKGAENGDGEDTSSRAPPQECFTCLNKVEFETGKAERTVGILPSGSPYSPPVPYGGEGFTHTWGDSIGVLEIDACEELADANPDIVQSAKDEAEQEAEDKCMNVPDHECEVDCQSSTGIPTCEPVSPPTYVVVPNLIVVSAVDTSLNYYICTVEASAKYKRTVMRYCEP